MDIDELVAREVAKVVDRVLANAEQLDSVTAHLAGVDAQAPLLVVQMRVARILRRIRMAWLANPDVGPRSGMPGDAPALGMPCPACGGPPSAGNYVVCRNQDCEECGEAYHPADWCGRHWSKQGE